MSKRDGAARARTCRLCIALAVAALLSPYSSDAADRSVEPVVSHIQREAVESTGLATVGYSKRLHVLEIEFHDGLIYRYLDVPTAVHRGLIESDSKARYYNHQIRGKYRCLRVRGKRTR
jgi:KTSC domain